MLRLKIFLSHAVKAADLSHLCNKKKEIDTMFSRKTTSADQTQSHKSSFGPFTSEIRWPGQNGITPYIVIFVKVFGLNFFELVGELSIIDNADWRTHYFKQSTAACEKTVRWKAEDTRRMGIAELVDLPVVSRGIRKVEWHVH